MEKASFARIVGAGTVRGTSRRDSFATRKILPPRQLTKGGRIPHVAKASPHAIFYDRGHHFRGDNLFCDTGRKVQKPACHVAKLASSQQLLH